MSFGSRSSQYTVTTAASWLNLLMVNALKFGTGSTPPSQDCFMLETRVIAMRKGTILFSVDMNFVAMGGSLI